MGSVMIQLTRSGTTFSGEVENLTRLRAKFRQTHFLRLHQLIQPELLKQVVCSIEKAQFKPAIDAGIATELRLENNPALHILQFLANDRRLFQIIDSITDCGRIGCFAGRIYRFVPGLGHYDSWHRDLTESRMIAMSINLSPQPYAGGILQLYDDTSGQIQGITNTGFGDGILFRIAPQLRHRITEVSGTTAKTAFAGWFQSTPDFYTELKRDPALID
jgi:hypothetical protein